MRRNGAAVFLCLLAGLTGAVAADAETAVATEQVEPGSRVLARVNGEELFAEDVASVLGEIHKRSDTTDRAQFDNEQLLFRLVNDTLLAQEARALELDQAPALRERLADSRAATARERIYREEIGKRITISDEDLAAVYADVYRTATLTMLSRRDRDEARALRDEFLATEDAETVAALARERSQDPYAPRGGKIENVPLVDLYESILEFATTASPGDVSEPLITPFGWSILRLEENLAPADPEKNEGARRNTTLAVLRFRRVQARRAEMLPGLKERYPVVVDEEAVAAIEPQRMPDGRLVPHVDRPERVALRIGDRAIDSATLGSALADAWANVGNPLIAERIRGLVIDDIVFDELLVAEARRRGYDATPEVEREIHALETRLLVQSYLQETVATRMDIETDVAQAYYEEHRESFRRPPRLRVRQLSVPTEAQAQKVLELARAGADFVWLVEQYSTDGFKEKGGDRGWMPANAGLTLFRSELTTAEAGDLLGPKAFDESWVVAKVDAAEDQGTYTFDQVSGNVKAWLVDQKIAERLDATISALRERSEIWIAEDAAEILTATPVQATPSAGSSGHSSR